MSNNEGSSVRFIIGDKDSAEEQIMNNGMYKVFGSTQELPTHFDAT